jgi:hypothetical protein
LPWKWLNPRPSRPEPELSETPLPTIDRTFSPPALLRSVGLSFPYDDSFYTSIYETKDECIIKFFERLDYGEVTYHAIVSHVCNGEGKVHLE